MKISTPQIRKAYRLMKLQDLDHMSRHRKKKKRSRNLDSGYHSSPSNENATKTTPCAHSLRKLEIAAWIRPLPSSRPRVLIYTAVLSLARNDWYDSYN